MRRLPLVIWAVYLIVMPAAWALSDYTVIGSDRSVDLHGMASEDLAAVVGLTAAEQAAAGPLLDRRLSLRIRGLELRYTVGKTVSSEGDDAGSLASIRHQIELIDAEIAFIDQELRMLLAGYAMRTGPWLVMSDDFSVMWLVPAPPCRRVDNVAIATNFSAAWQPVGLVIEGLPDDVDTPGSCSSLRLSIDGLSLGSSPDHLMLRVNGKVYRFMMVHR